MIIIGAGALGSASAEMLARAGVGQLTIVDRDYVEWSNLHRQQLYSEADAENKWPKAAAAKARIEQINSDVAVESIVTDVHGLNIEQLIQGHTLIVDAVDNFETKLIVNDAAVKLGIPFLFGACVASYGLTFPVQPGKTPCLHCLLDQLPVDTMTCDTVGVIGPIVQTTAAHQAAQALRILSGEELPPILHSADIWKDEKARINVSRLKRHHCPTCGEQPAFPYLSFENQTKTEILCGRDAVQLRPGISASYSLERLASGLKPKVKQAIVNPFLISCQFDEYRVVFFKDGRAIIHGTHEPKTARAVYSRLLQHY